MTTGLDVLLLGAHEADDKPQLVALYTRAANESEAAGDVDRACFYLTHAWIFALEIDDPEKAVLNARLAAFGREVEQRFDNA